MFQRMGRRLREARELGSYELVEQLGHGGMGEVWRARHRLLARQRRDQAGAARAARRRQRRSEARLLLRRFEREAQATAALSSPHTHSPVRLRRRPTTARFYYVMELLDGRDLESLVREFGPLPADRAMFLLRQVCHSLADAHARGLVHRDIKPANIYVCRMGLDYDFVKVLDFGLVKFNDAPSRDRDADADDGGAHDDRHARVHGAGDHPRRRRRRPARRRLRARLRRLLSAHRPAGVRGATRR